MKAVILAAGLGSRMGNSINAKPKCLLKFQSSTLLGRLISQFKKYKVNDIIILTGYKSNEITNLYGKSYKCIFYEDYDKTNNLQTLWSIKDLLDDETIISFADVVVEDEIIKKIVNSNYNFSLLIDTAKLRDNTMYVSNKENLLKSITITKKKEATGNFIGISKVKTSYLKHFINSMSKLIGKSNDYYYTMAINLMIENNLKINTIDVNGKFWTEIDEPADYKKLLLKKAIIQ